MRYRLPRPSWWPRKNADILVIHPWKVAYARVPKAANSSVKASIAAALNLAPIDGVSTSRDRYWNEIARSGIAELVSVKDFALEPRFRDYFCFSVVREPVARVVSCYRGKILRNKELSKGFLKRGYRLGMSFDEFVRRACAENDGSCDIHLRSQHTMTCYQDRPIPQLLVRVDELDQRWSEITDQILLKAKVDLGPLPRRNDSAKVSTEIRPNPEQLALIRKRYAKDYELLFPEM